MFLLLLLLYLPLCNLFQETYHSPSLVENPSSQLTSENQPFFRDLLPLSPGLKSFCDQVLATERDIFNKCTIRGFNTGWYFLQPERCCCITGEAYSVDHHDGAISEVAEVISDDGANQDYWLH